MRLCLDSPSSLRSLSLAASLLLVSTTGCQGEQPPPQVTRTESRVIGQGLSCGASLVPIMSSATAPAGTVTRSSAYEPGYEAWMAFDATDSGASMWLSGVGQAPAWLAYEWPDGPKGVTHYAITYVNGSITSRAPRVWTLEGWNGNAWVVVDTRTNEVNWGGVERREYAVASPGFYGKYRLHVTDDNDSRTGIETISIGRLELFNCGCMPSQQVPAMTSATAPGGTVSRSGAYSASYEGWLAFDGNDTSASMWISQAGQTPAWLAYEWADGSRKITHYAIKFTNGSLTSRAPRVWTLEGWNGSAWVVVDTRTNEVNWLSTDRRQYTVAAPGNFSKYRLHMTDDNDTRTGIEVVSLARLELLGCLSDTVPPVAPTLTGFAPASPSSNAKPTLSGTAEAGATVRIYPGAACGGTAVAATTASASGAFSSAVSVTLNATSSFSATATDPAGNASPCSPSVSYLHDGVAPATPALTGFTPTSPGRSLSPQLRGTAEAGATVRVFSGGTCAGTSLAALAAAADGTFSTTLAVASDTTSTFSVTATDAAGNVSACSPSIAYRHDGVAPSAPVLTGLSPVSPSNNAKPTFSGTAEPGATVRVFSGTACGGTALATLTATTSGTFSGLVSVTPNTTTTLTATATDAAGNVSPCAPGISYLHDGVAPATPSQLGFSPASPGPALTPELRGSTERGASVHVFRGANCPGTALVKLTADATTGGFATPVSVSANAQTGFSARAVDAVGNTSACSVTVVYLNDTLAPSAPAFIPGVIPVTELAFVGAVRATTEARAWVALYADAACSIPHGTERQANTAGEVLLPLRQDQLGVPVFARSRDAAGNVSGCVSFQEDCANGFADCDGDPSNGCEADLLSDESHCGACGTVCAGAPSANAVCGAGTCGLGCVVDTFDCDGDAANGCESTTACDAAVCAVDPFEELLIIDLSVVEDPMRTTGNGPWTFGTLMRQMAGGEDPTGLVLPWLFTWMEPQFIGATEVPPRPDIMHLVIDPWIMRSGGHGAPLDFSQAPFRLLAIVNRMDLRSEGNHAGEGRFVFGVTDPFGGALPFTVILEYELPGGSPEELQRWARDWHELGRLGLGHPDYNAKLQALTDRFTKSFVARGRFLGSAIHQVRTNENALHPLWELREFHYGPQGLTPAPVALTPDINLNQSSLLARYLNQNAPKILEETHDVPTNFEGQLFLGGAAPTFSPRFAWNAPEVDPEVRHKFSLNTCSGCHGGETDTPFVHLFFRSPGQIAFPSRFLFSTAPTPDPFDPQKTRVFDDLGRRQRDLKALVCGGPAPVSLTKDRTGESLLAPRRLERARVPGFPVRSNLPPGRVH